MIDKYIQNYLSSTKDNRASYESYAESEDIARAISTAIQDTIKASEDAHINSLNKMLEHIMGNQMTYAQELKARNMFRESINL